MIYNTEQDILEELAHEIRGDVREDIWEFLLEDGRVDDVSRGAVGIEELAAHYRRLTKIGRKGHIKSSGETESQTGSAEIGPDERLLVLSSIIAKRAAQQPDVKVFRNEVLKGNLLAQDEVESWIKQKAEEDGPTTVYLTFPIPNNRLKSGRYGMPWAEPDMLIQEDNPPTGWSQSLLAYQTPTKQGTHRVPVACDGILGQLHALSQRLSKKFDWTESQATVFVLTDVPPLHSRAILTIDHQWPFSGTTRIHLELDATLSPQTVMDIFRRARAELGQNHHRPMSSKHLRLAEFYGGERTQTWAALMNDWNKVFPDWKYLNIRNFSRDCQHAWRRIIGQELAPFISIDGQELSPASGRIGQERSIDLSNRTTNLSE